MKKSEKIVVTYLLLSILALCSISIYQVITSDPIDHTPATVKDIAPFVPSDIILIKDTANRFYIGIYDDSDSKTHILYYASDSSNLQLATDTLKKLGYNLSDTAIWKIDK